MQVSSPLALILPASRVDTRDGRDANGFKMHTQSESHVRQIIIIGEDPKKYVSDFSNEFLKDFIQLLKTGHGEKSVSMNRVSSPSPKPVPPSRPPSPSRFSNEFASFIKSISQIRNTSI